MELTGSVNIVDIFFDVFRRVTVIPNEGNPFNLALTLEFNDARLILIRALANMAVTSDEYMLEQLWEFVQEPNGPCIKFPAKCLG